MSIPGNANSLLLTTAAETGYQVSRSLRFNSSDSVYCVRTPASVGNRQKYTWSGWVKRSTLATKTHVLFTGYSNDFQYTFIAFNSSDQILINDYQSSTNQINLVTASVYRDSSAWYHIVLAVDTTIASPSSDRVKLYVNGTQVTSFSTSTYPSQNLSTNINNNTTHYLGHFSIANVTNNYFNGYLADVHFIDGQALTPSSFTDVSATTGQLIPKAYTGSYGTNGFRLPFSDNSGTTATTLGKDAAGSNNWTPNNFSVTAGAGNDSLVDSPTSYGTDTGAGGEVRGNYCTLNPLASGGTLSNGNLNWVQTAFAIRCAFGTIAQSSGKWYYEVKVNTQAEQANSVIGISRSTNPSAYPDGYYYVANGNKADRNSSSVTSYGATYGVGDIIGVAYDLTAGTITFYKNGVSQGTAFTTLGSYPGNYAPACFTDGVSSISVNHDFNFGQRPFAYTAPSGFKALCDTNLPAPVVAKPNEVMDVLTWTGTGGNRTFTGLRFSPDLVWGKGRSAAYNHQLYDIVRGTGSTKDLQSNATSAEGSSGAGLYGYISAFNSDGFATTSGSTDNSYWNGSSTTYAAWCWDAGSSTVTNTQGSITSTVSVRANASAGFSVVTYTGTGVNCTVGHGLNVAPSLIIVKSRSVANDWAVYHAANTSDPKTDYLLLNSTAATADDNTYWNDTAPTSTVFSIGTNADVNTNGTTYVAYCWAPLVGYSAMGSYTGNGSADGPFVYTGFRPRYLCIKSSSFSDQWLVLDAARNTYNVVNLHLHPNLANNESSLDWLDFTSNGFKIRTTYSTVNQSSGSFIYFAFAENPFAYARAR